MENADSQAGAGQRSASSSTSPPANVHSDLLSNIPASASSIPKANTRVRRRQKRDGPPQLQFLTATDPSQFKDENAKRSVRSQAMIQYRYKADQQRRTDPKEKGKGKGKQPVVGLERGTSTTTKFPRSNSHEKIALEPSTFPDEDDDDSLEPSHPSRYLRALALLPPNPNAPRVTDYEQTPSNEEKNMQELLRQLSSKIGNGVDPFLVLPQFDNPELHSLYLVSKCHRGFTSRATMLTWIPSMLSHPHLILSATGLASSWLDMHDGISGDSRRTVLIKAEVISWINLRLRNPTQQFEDNTLVVILHLLAGEMWSANEETLRIHEMGVARLIAHRGGLGSLGGYGVMAAIAASCCFHTDIICETPMLPVFKSFHLPTFLPLNPDTVMPESPMFCPRNKFFTLVRDKRCSPRTYELLCDLRDLTDIFLGFHKSYDVTSAPDIDEGYSGGDDGYSGGGLTPQEYDTKIAKIRARLARYPSIQSPGSAMANDWIYESCRIAAIIYASSIIMRVPFSFVSEPGRAVLLSDSNAAIGIPDPLASRRLSDALYEALERSGTADIWGDMCGVLYFVTLVGGAAARSPSTTQPPSPEYRGRSNAMWARRCLIMFATRTMIILIFQYPHAVINAQQKLMKVQELIKLV